MCISLWMFKENVIYSYNGILLSPKKEQSTDSCYSIDKPRKHYAKWKKSDTKGNISFYLYEMFRLHKALELK